MRQIEHSPNAHNGQSWLGPKPGAGNSLQVSHVGDRSPALSHPLPPRIGVIRKLESEPDSGTPVWDTDVLTARLNVYSPRACFLLLLNIHFSVSKGGWTYHSDRLLINAQARALGKMHA